jgi:branched-chain amino acid transport system permease protein
VFAVTFLTQVLNGLQLGSIYALVALGYTMVYGIILLLNFAHGDIIMVGAYISWIVMSQLGLSPVLAIVLSILGCAVLGVLIDKVAYQPLREAPRMSLLITAIGVSYFLENVAQLLFGADAKVVPTYFELGNIQLGDVQISATAVATIVVTAISTSVLTLLVQKTKLGKAMRAVSEDMGAARLMGINVNTTISFTFAVGSALAGVGAVLYSMAYSQATPTMGIMLGTKAFVAAVLGGIGSIPGAVIGGLIVGFAEVFVSAIGLSTWKDAVVYLLLIIVLVVRPTGILGRPMTEKV